MRSLSTIALLLVITIGHAQHRLVDYLPEKTHTLIALNPARLGKKIPAEIFRQSYMYRMLLKDPESPPAKLLMDLTATGINMEEAYIIVSGGNSPGSGTSHLLVKLDSPDKFRTWLEGTWISAEKIQTYGTDNIVFMEGKGVLAWNRQVLIVANDTGDEEQDMENEYSVNDTSTEAIERWIEKQAYLEQKKLRDIAFELLTPRPGSRLSADLRFRALMAEAGDIKMWNESSSDPMLRQVFPFHNVLSKFTSMVGGTKTGVVNFEKGKVVMKSKNYQTTEMAAILDKNPIVAAGNELGKLLPAGRVLATMHASYNSSVVADLMSKLPAEIADSAQKYLSLDITKLHTVFGNHAMLAVVQNDDGKPAFDVVMALPIADPAAFNLLKQKVLKLYDSVSKSEDSADIVGKVRPFIRHNDKMMVFSLSDNRAQNFLEGKDLQPAPQWYNEYTSKYPFFMHANLGEFVNRLFVGKDEKNEIEDLVVLEDMIAYGGEYSNGATTSTTELRFKDKEKNSLGQFFEMMNGFIEKMDEEKNYDIEVPHETTEMHEDTTTTTVADPWEHLDGALLSMIPEFRDTTIKPFLEEYTLITLAYRKSLSDSAHNSDAAEKYFAWEERARVMGKKLDAKSEEAKNYYEYVAMLREFIPEDARKPRSNQKFTPPVMKKD